MDETRLQQLLAIYLERSTLVVPHEFPCVIHDDPDDDIFVHAAIAGGASYIVSGDPHFLRVGSYRGINMISPREFSSRFEDGIRV